MFARQRELVVTSQLVLVTLLCIMNVNAQLSPGVQALVENMQSMQDSTADPCVDFFQYACGTYIKDNPVPANITGPKILYAIIDRAITETEELLSDIVHDSWPIINDLYLSCLKQDLQTDFDIFFISQVHQIDNTNLQSEDNFMQLIASLIYKTVPAFFGTYTYVGYDQLPTNYLSPAGNSLTAEQYSDPVQYNILLSQIEAVFELFESSEDTYADAVAVISIEVFISQSLNCSLENITLSYLSEVTSTDYGTLLEDIGIVASDSTYFEVTCVPFFAKLPGVVATFSERTVQRFLEWKIYQTVSSFNISSCWDTSSPGPYCGSIMILSPNPPPWNQKQVCTFDIVEDNLASDYVGLILSSSIVPPDADTAVVNMTHAIQSAFNSSLSSLGWLDANGVSSVEFKLSNIIEIVGHPNYLNKYDNVTTSSATYYKNVFDLTGANHRFSNSFLSGPFNRSFQEFEPLLVNAQYGYYTNTINFPAAILESPMFSSTWPKLFQYARLGYIVGHENTHGFDSYGGTWNAFGLPGNLFDNATTERFNYNSQCIADYYSQYIVFNTTHLNGNQTLVENIADIGGMKNSFRAYETYVTQNGPEFKDGALLPGLTTDQVFFLFMGQTWCSSSNLAYDEFLYYLDNHAPTKYRVNGGLSQTAAFSEAFSCPANAPMNPSSRCDLW